MIRQEALPDDIEFSPTLVGLEHYLPQGSVVLFLGYDDESQLELYAQNGHRVLAVPNFPREAEESNRLVIAGHQPLDYLPVLRFEAALSSFALCDLSLEDFGCIIEKLQQSVLRGGINAVISKLPTYGAGPSIARLREFYSLANGWQIEEFNLFHAEDTHRQVVRLIATRL